MKKHTITFIFICVILALIGLSIVYEVKDTKTKEKEYLLTEKMFIELYELAYEQGYNEGLITSTDMWISGGQTVLTDKNHQNRKKKDLKKAAELLHSLSK